MPYKPEHIHLEFWLHLLTQFSWRGLFIPIINIRHVGRRKKDEISTCLSAQTRTTNQFCYIKKISKSDTQMSCARLLMLCSLIPLHEQLQISSSWICNVHRQSSVAYVIFRKQRSSAAKTAATPNQKIVYMFNTLYVHNVFSKPCCALPLMFFTISSRKRIFGTPKALERRLKSWKQEKQGQECNRWQSTRHVSGMLWSSVGVYIFSWFQMCELFYNFFPWNTLFFYF